ncbi:MAG: aspartate kinase [Planctomycetaceae bacterium]|nr:aspartate kinase [Planctomycetaceae bacterium]
MSIVVQKFGGSSLADSSKIMAAARKVIAAREQGHQVVTVVSAMGRYTDHLIELAREINQEPPAREMDMLLATGEQVSVALMAMAINALGHSAISLTGAQIGIITDSVHTKARIRSISTDRIRKALDAGKIVIAAGFQGMDERKNITTLGRGGSDTTAVALAAVLHADACEIYTDVDGVYSADPHIVADARRLQQISYDEMLELAMAGAGVMHNRSIELAKKFDVPVHVRSSFSDQAGTMIVRDPESPGQPVCGAAMTDDEARVTVLGVPDRPGAAWNVFSKVAKQSVALDMIVQNEAADGRTDISFTVAHDDLPVTLQAIEQVVNELGAEGYSHDQDAAKISVVGLGITARPGVAGMMFRALAESGINIQMISTSRIKVSAVVAREFADEALCAVHKMFELQALPAQIDGHSRNAGAMLAEEDTAKLVARLRRMDNLIIEGIELDDSQARVTFPSLPDIPGLAAQTFDELAEAGIMVDMIVQSIARQNRASISFTVPRQYLRRAMDAATDLTVALHCAPPTHCPAVAKLSVCGVGMRSHTGVASRMFQSLAKAGINVGMINTSEVCANVIVDGQHGQAAIDALKAEFAEETI